MPAMCDRYSRFAACGGYQIRGQTFLLVQQDLQKVFGLEMLMIAHERRRLCSLHKSSCPLSAGLQFHRLRSNVRHCD
jgi:hypothetical protein